ncbi:XRE family transcriptional regulator [Streptomyces endophyticus]|uniref:XRE family transcriptional regulator n=1 Tax=Streptomyces endophyticus TaxID=714166 RepID=A0ABU6F7Y6_9ACTN|nr:XRE family transcriptional regulator [Streptomyces endophyticus]MEB8339767.1 XRE family transcriptional regulator [Streptomyces endophyticus]
MANDVLKRRMGELDMTQEELAEKLNDAVHSLTGSHGKATARTVWNLQNRVEWPYTKIRMALEIVFGCPVEELGFTPRTVKSAETKDEEPVDRRNFGALAAGIALGAAAPGTLHRVGTSDVMRLHRKFAEIIAKDHRQGGRKPIEHQALGLAGEALGLLNAGSSSQRVKSLIYSTAASFTSSAMWAAIDGRRFEAAQRHFDRASSLAGMSGDQAIQFRIWSHAGTLYRHLARPADALAANDVARRLRVTRGDPLFAALGHARHAAIHGVPGDTRAIRRCMDLAEDAYTRSSAFEQDRPVWLTAFFDRAELHSLATAAYLAAHEYEDAEANAHQSLALLRAPLARSRAITTARLAHGHSWGRAI